MANKKSNKTKRYEKKIEEVKNDFDDSILGKVYIVLGILIFFSLFYLLTLYITNKNTEKPNDNSSDDVETTISYEKIMLGRSFSMSDGEYYVVYYDSSDDDISSSINDIISSYKSGENVLTIYTVDMHDAFNSVYSSETSNNHPNNVNEIQINGPTLIKFNNHEVSGYFEGIDSIKDELS